MLLLCSQAPNWPKLQKAEVKIEQKREKHGYEHERVERKLLAQKKTPGVV